MIRLQNDKMCTLMTCALEQNQTLQSGSRWRSRQHIHSILIWCHCAASSVTAAATKNAAFSLTFRRASWYAAKSLYRKPDFNPWPKWLRRIIRYMTPWAAGRLSNGLDRVCRS